MAERNYEYFGGVTAVDVYHNDKWYCGYISLLQAIKNLTYLAKEHSLAHEMTASLNLGERLPLQEAIGMLEQELSLRIAHKALL